MKLTTMVGTPYGLVEIFKEVFARLTSVESAAASNLGTTNEELRAWAAAEAYPSFTPSRDSDGVITTATLTWPDGSAGVFTTVVKNATFLVIDSFTVTHTASGRTITQPTMTRDSNGNVTVRPALTIV